jgi:transcriptional regulator with XRE-family HTH domain
MEPGIAHLIDELLDTTAGRLEDVASEAGVSYSALYSWATGRRSPNPENLARLASVASRRADRLASLADGIRERVNGAGEAVDSSS